MKRADPLCLTSCAAMLISACSPNAPDASTKRVYADNSCGGAPANWSPKGSERGELAIFNALAFSPRGYTWNGAPTAEATASEYVSQVRGKLPAINIQIVFDPQSDCASVQRARALVSSKLQCGKREKCVEYSSEAYAAERLRHAVH
jgi:hypothetical protein